MEGTYSFKRIVVGAPRIVDIDTFRVIAEAAAGAGATHVTVSGLHAKSRWEVDDPADPYAQWTIFNPTVFFFAVPEAMKDIVPADFAERALDSLCQQSEIAASLGLRRAYLGREPHCWPEVLFERHPHWRGPRVDHPRRSRHARFALCVDNPEVLEMYRSAVKKITEAAGGIEVFLIGSNDAGTGLCWAEKLYNNPNGPAACRHRHMGQRVGDLLSSIVAGAGDAGSEAQAFIMAKFSPNELALMAHTFPPNVGLSARPGYSKQVPTITGMGVPTILPVIGVTQPIGLLESLERANDAGAETLMLSYNDGSDVSIAATLLRRFLDEPTHGLQSRMALLQRVAADEFGKEVAEEIIELWDRIRKGTEAAFQVSLGGSMFRLGILAQRWLTRPLVAFPAELPPEEKDYYRRFQFQANTEAEADDILNTQGIRQVTSRSQAFFVGQTLDGAAGQFSAAARIAVELASKASEEAARMLTALDYRLRTLACLARTFRNVVQFQTLLDESLAELGEEGPREKPWLFEGYGNRQKMYDVVRAEVDNTQALIDLIEESPVPVLITADDPAEEDPFTLGPALLEQLRAKIRITIKHWRDFERIYPRPNR